MTTQRDNGRDHGRFGRVTAFAKRRPFEVILTVSLLAGLVVAAWPVGTSVLGEVERVLAGRGPVYFRGEFRLWMVDGPDLATGFVTAIVVFVTLTGLILSRRALNRPSGG